MNAIERISALLDKVLAARKSRTRAVRSGAAAARAARIAMLRHKARLGRGTSGFSGELQG